jgi:hypothetical protein
MDTASANSAAMRFLYMVFLDMALLGKIFKKNAP